MSIAATVENDIIKLPEGIHVPDGTRVEIILEDTAHPVSQSPLAWMAEFAGSITTLPRDASERHTEYAHGRKQG